MKLERRLTIAVVAIFALFGALALAYRPMRIAWFARTLRADQADEAGREEAAWALAEIGGPAAAGPIREAAAEHDESGLWRALHFAGDEDDRFAAAVRSFREISADLSFPMPARPGGSVDVGLIYAILGAERFDEVEVHLRCERAGALAVAGPVRIAPPSTGQTTGKTYITVHVAANAAPGIYPVVLEVIATNRRETVDLDGEGSIRIPVGSIAIAPQAAEPN